MPQQLLAVSFVDLVAVVASLARPRLVQLDAIVRRGPLLSMLQLQFEGVTTRRVEGKMLWGPRRSVGAHRWLRSR